MKNKIEMFEKILEWDKELFLWLNFDGGPFWDNFFWLVTGKIIWVPLYLFIMWLIYRRLGLRNAILAAVFIGLTVVVTDHICNFFKDYVPKLRPTHNPELQPFISLVNNYRGAPTGTVSAHASVSFAIIMFSSLIVKNKWFTLPMIGWGLLVCYSRIYVNAHFPMDLFFGIILGVLTGWLALVLYRKTIVWLDEREKRKLKEAKSKSTLEQ